VKAAVLAMAVLAAALPLTACERGGDSQASAAQAGISAPKVTLDSSTEEQARYDRERRPDLLIAALGIGPGKRVADIGAGSGLLTVHLARAVLPDGEVVATDIDRAVLDLLAARTRAAGVDKVIERRVVKENDPGLEANAYDAILVSHVDHYFANPVAWLTAAAPALKPTGVLVITNRIHHRAQSLAAAAKAGLVLVSESNPLPSLFVAVFNRP
jgi:predicted O-methyltransferase YrrM